MENPSIRGMADPHANDVARHSQHCYILETGVIEARMYICLCNVLTDRDVRSGCDGAQSVSTVYRALGCEPRCGKCVPLVRQMWRESGAGAEADAGDD